jgi:hypothetical protein
MNLTSIGRHFWSGLGGHISAKGLKAIRSGALSCFTGYTWSARPRISIA